MSITKHKLNQIIKEELTRVTEGYGSSGRGGRGYRYGGGDMTGYKGSYNDTPWYRAGGSGRMSDAEAREMGARGYDEPNEPDYERGPRGGLVHSTVTIYVDPTQASDKFNANLGPRLDKSADVFLGMSGYDGMVGNLVTGRNPQTGFNDIGARWVLAKSPEGYTFTTGGTVGTGSSPSAALRDAAQQGFQGSDVVLGALGGGMGGGLEESRDLSKDPRTAGEPVNMRKVRMIANKMINKYADDPESLELEVQELGDIYQGYDAETPAYKSLNRAEAITLRDILAREADNRFTARSGGGDVDGAGDAAPPRGMTQYTGDNLYESRWRKLAGISESATCGQLREFRFPWEDEPMYEQTPFTRYLESAAATLKRNMISRAGGKDGFDEDYLRVVVGPSSDPRTGYTGRTGESYGDMILRVYFERGDFPVVGGVYSTKEELVAAGTVALAQAAGAMSASAPTVKDATVIQVGGRDPDFGSTYGWQMTLNPPVTK